jgi:hypothetical protein
MKRIVLLALFVLMSVTSYSQLFTKQRESYYQNLFATRIGGQKEVILPDQTRVDVLTDTFAIEVDFADKWSQSVGQSLYYAEKLHKKAGILLIIDGLKDDRFVKRLMTVAYKHDITVWILDYNDESWGKVDVRINYIY